MNKGICIHNGFLRKKGAMHQIKDVVVEMSDYKDFGYLCGKRVFKKKESTARNMGYCVSF